MVKRLARNATVLQLDIHIFFARKMTSPFDATQTMNLIRPRITDYFGIYKAQAELDFAIQFLDEDIPLYVDPFLLWKSPSQQDQALHTALTNSFNHLNFLAKKNRENEAIETLISLSECPEVGLGVARNRKGARIGIDRALQILRLFSDIPEYSQFGFTHFEVIQLYVDGISKDRVSDFSCNYLKSFLIDYTIDQCQELGIPIERTLVASIYNYQKNRLDKDSMVTLPINPISKEPVIFTPKRWLRFSPWINYEDYFQSACPKDKVLKEKESLERVKVLKFNRENYGTVESYVNYRVRNSEDCKNDPLFSQIPIVSAKRKLAQVLKLETGKEDGADWRYEDLVSTLLASMFYPHLDFADTQSRTDSGRHIRDLIFYNNRDIDFLDEIYTDYGNRQLIVELKNVKSIERDHINQLNRYMQSDLGGFGVLFTRNELSKAMLRNTVDLWSSQRRAIISVTDEDLKLMVQVYESRQRAPVDVLKKKYIQFRRACPS